MNNIIVYGRVLKKCNIVHKEDGTSSIRFMMIAKRNRSKEIDVLPCFATGKTSNIINEFVQEKERLVVMGTINTWAINNEDDTKNYGWHIYVSGVEFVENQKDKTDNIDISSESENDFDYPTEQEIEIFDNMDNYTDYINEYENS